MKTIILVTVRLKSTRLPMKAIKLIHGKPLIVHILDRLKLAKTPAEVVMCTSTVKQDDPLEVIAAQEGIKCFRGHPDDVLLRLTEAAKENSADVVMHCTGDNPFVDWEYIDQAAGFHITRGNDFTKTEGLPWGAFPYAISTQAMERACEIKDAVDTEVWHGYFMETGLFKWETMIIDNPRVKWPELRVTVDTEQDFAFTTRVFDELYNGKDPIALEDVVALCRDKPEIPEINKMVQQKVHLPIKLKSQVEASA